jgi:hypothetical protein
MSIASLVACDHARPHDGSTTRLVEIRALPGCPKRSGYERPLVVRLDRERSLFDDPFSVQQRLDAPVPIVALTVPRRPMRASVRIGTCTKTSLATWDCAAARWLASTSVDLDGRASPASLDLPAISVPCVPLATRE